MFWQKKKIKLETRSKSVRPFLLSEIGHPGKNNFTPSLQEVVLRACEKKIICLEEVEKKVSAWLWVTKKVIWTRS